MPLASFPQCYGQNFEPLVDHHDGVPLEHYISCIKDIQIVTGQGVIKKVQFSHTPGVSFLPTPFDTANSNETKRFLFLIESNVGFSACGNVC